MDDEGVDADGVREVLTGERAATVGRIERLVADFAEMVAASADTNADDEHDPEGSTIAFERAQIAALLAQSRTYLDEIDRASTRLDAGNYAMCEKCGARIAPERLTARPTAMTCIRCASMHG